MKISTETQKDFDLKRYLGTWYDVAHIPTLPWQKGCVDSVAEYSMINDITISVKNTCITPRGQFSRSGEARVANIKDASKLKIFFNDGLPADPEGWYWVYWTDYDRYAIVSGGPGSDYLWILSRTPQIPVRDVDMLLRKVDNAGYDSNRLVSKPKTIY